MDKATILPFMNPATGEQFGQVAMATPAGVQQARQEMGEAALVWREKPVRERIRILKQFQELLIDSLDEITAVLNQDCGKTRQDALIETFITVDILHRYCQKAPRWLQKQRVSPGLYLFKRCYTEQRPYGVVGVIGPWNYPLVLTLSPTLTALLAGNAVLLKPSEVTPATGVLIEKLFQRVPELSPFVRVLHGDGRVGEALVKAKPDLIFLTGSTMTGKKALQTAAADLTPVICELGGKDPMIVLEDADIDAAARWGVWGAFFNAGQTCMAVERVYVVEAVYDTFVEKALAYTEEFKPGYSEEKESPYSMGPLTFERQCKIIEDHLQDAIDKGARILTGGERRDMFMPPTVIVDVTHEMKLMQEENFGPVMPIMKVKDEAEAIRLANDSPYGLSGYVWSQDIARAERVAGQLQAGTLLVNDVLSHFAITELPFGGVKQSGNGRIHGRQDFLQFTQTHAYAVGRPPVFLDIATHLRQPGRYWLGAAILRLVFGATPRQRLQPLWEKLPGERESGAPAAQPGRQQLARLGLAAALVTAAWGLWRALR